jgi:hypothetical protein
MAPDAGREATDADDADEKAAETGDDGRTAETGAARGTGSPLVDRWTALDRGWQALALGLGIVAVHAAGQVAGVF